MDNNLRRGRHSVSALYSHLVFVAKYRRSIFTAEHLNAMSKSFDGVAQKMGFRVLEFNGEPNHVHVLIEYPPKLSISKMVNHLKGVSSRHLRQQFDLQPHGKHLWSPSYFACSCGGAPIKLVQEYIQQQDSPEKPS